MELVKTYCEYTNVLEEEYYVVNGKKEGVYKKYTPDGNIRKTCYYVNNQINGEYIKYYRNINGTVYNITNYVDGIKHGKTIYYHENGNIETEASYVNGILQGESRNYYDNQQLKGISYHTQGLFMTTRSEYYKNGNLKNIFTFTSYPNKMETKVYFEHINGQINAIGNSTDGILDDLIIYFPNGNVKVTFNRIDKMCSQKKVYDENGELIEDLNYTNGENFTINYQLGHNIY